MERVTASMVRGMAGQPVRLAGWVHRTRPLGGVTFIVLRDRSGMIQCVAEGIAGARELTPESVITLTGDVVAEPRAAEGVEVHVAALEVLSPAPAMLPFEINKKTIDANFDLQLDERVLALRHPRNRAIFRIQSALADGFRRALLRRDFVEVHTPKLVATGTEGGAEMFPVQYFERQAYLAQSPQFYKQMMVLAGLERVFEVGPVFRAESHNTSRHLNEYTSLDLEMGFIESEDDVMALEEQVLGETLALVAESCRAEVALLGATVPLMHTVPRISVPDAVQLLAAKYGWESPNGEINPEGERLLGEWASKEHGSDFVFLTHFPAAKRPAYTMPRPEDPTLTRSFDLLFRGLEITTGGQRINDYEQLVASFRRVGYNPESFASYLGAFRFGAPPHGGLAIGLERLTGRLLNLSNIRETTLFPRDRDRLTP